MNPHEEFDRIVAPEFPQESLDNNPYNAPLAPVKPGLTKRGKGALAIGATVIAVGGFAFYQHNAAIQSANHVKSQELALQQQQLELEKLKVLGKVNTAQEKTQSVADAARQKKVDACVADNKGLVGKQLGATYRSVLNDCQAQYAAASNSTGADMQSAASVTDPSTGDSNATTWLLVAGGAAVIGVGSLVRKGTRPTTA